MFRGVRGFFLAVAGVLGVMVGYALWEQRNVRPQIPSMIGRPAPPLELQVIAMDGTLVPETLRLEDFRGKWVILNFWASWCVECRREVEVLNTFWESLPEGFPLVVIGVNVWDTPRGIRGFLRQYPIRFLDGRDLSGTAGARYGLTGVPETFLVDPEGVIRDHVLGAVSPVWLEGVRKRIERMERGDAADRGTPSP